MAIGVGLPVAIVLFVIASAVFFLRPHHNDSRKILAEPRGADGELTQDQISKLMGLMISDAEASSKRNKLENAMANHGKVGAVILGWFPDRSQQTLAITIREGHAASRPLVAMVADPKATVFAPLMVMVEAADPYGAMQALAQRAAAGGADKATTGQIITACLPWSHPDPAVMMDPVGWLKSEIESKTLDEIYLERLDVATSDPRLYPTNPFVLMWLNRFYGVDFDEWLAEKAPEVLAFRYKELARGYDPVALLVNPWIWLRTDEATLKQIFPDEAERTCMKKLAAFVKGAVSPSQLPGQAGAGWQAKFMAWYTANRHNLVYDRVRRRFVVKEPETAGSRMESTGTR
jgi:hypothetical protein